MSGLNEEFATSPFLEQFDGIAASNPTKTREVAGKLLDQFDAKLDEGLSEDEEGRAASKRAREELPRYIAKQQEKQDRVAAFGDLYKTQGPVATGTLEAQIGTRAAPSNAIPLPVAPTPTPRTPEGDGLYPPPPKPNATTVMVKDAKGRERPSYPGLPPSDRYKDQDEALAEKHKLDRLYAQQRAKDENRLEEFSDRLRGADREMAESRAKAGLDGVPVTSNGIPYDSSFTPKEAAEINDILHRKYHEDPSQGTLGNLLQRGAALPMVPIEAARAAWEKATGGGAEARDWKKNPPRNAEERAQKQNEEEMGGAALRPNAVDVGMAVEAPALMAAQYLLPPVLQKVQERTSMSPQTAEAIENAANIAAIGHGAIRGGLEALGEGMRGEAPVEGPSPEAKAASARAGMGPEMEAARAARAAEAAALVKARKAVADLKAGPEGPEPGADLPEVTERLARAEELDRTHYTNEADASRARDEAARLRAEAEQIKFDQGAGAEKVGGVLERSRAQEGLRGAEEALKSGQEQQKGLEADALRKRGEAGLANENERLADEAWEKQAPELERKGAETLEGQRAAAEALKRQRYFDEEHGRARGEVDQATEAIKTQQRAELERLRTEYQRGVGEAERLRDPATRESEVRRMTEAARRPFEEEALRNAEEERAARQAREAAGNAFPDMVQEGRWRLRRRDLLRRQDAAVLRAENNARVAIGAFSSRQTRLLNEIAKAANAAHEPLSAEETAKLGAGQYARLRELRRGPVETNHPPGIKRPLENIMEERSGDVLSPEEQAAAGEGTQRGLSITEHGEPAPEIPMEHPETPPMPNPIAEAMARRERARAGAQEALGRGAVSHEPVPGPPGEAAPPAPTTPPAPPTPPGSGGVSVPFQMTGRMRQALADLGWRATEINAMTPEGANRRIANGERPRRPGARGAPAAPAAPAPEATPTSAPSEATPTTAAPSTATSTSGTPTTAPSRAPVRSFADLQRRLRDAAPTPEMGDLNAELVRRFAEALGLDPDQFAQDVFNDVYRADRDGEPIRGTDELAQASTPGPTTGDALGAKVRDLVSKDSSQPAGAAEAPELQGMVSFMHDGRAVIRAFQSQDASTIPHELGHVFRRQLAKYDPAGHEVLAKWAGAEGPKWSVDAEEKVARAFERYLADGQAPTKGLAGVFAKFKSWIVGAYKAITGSAIDLDVSPEVRRVFDKMLAGKEEVAKPAEATKAEAAAPATPAPAEAAPRPPPSGPAPIAAARRTPADEVEFQKQRVAQLRKAYEEKKVGPEAVNRALQGLTRAELALKNSQPKVAAKPAAAEDPKPEAAKPAPIAAANARSETPAMKARRLQKALNMGRSVMRPEQIAELEAQIKNLKGEGVVSAAASATGEARPPTPPTTTSAPKPTTPAVPVAAPKAVEPKPAKPVAEQIKDGFKALGEGMKSAGQERTVEQIKAGKDVFFRDSTWSADLARKNPNLKVEEVNGGGVRVVAARDDAGTWHEARTPPELVKERMDRSEKVGTEKRPIMDEHGRQYTYHVENVPIKDIRASHDIEGTPVQGYRTEFQERDFDLLRAQQYAKKYGTKLLLPEGTTPTSGSEVGWRDPETGLVQTVQGNHRHVSRLIADSPSPDAKIAIRVLDADYDAAKQFSAAGQRSGSAQENPLERGRAVAKALNLKVEDLPRGIGSKPITKLNAVKLLVDNPGLEKKIFPQGAPANPDAIAERINDAIAGLLPPAVQKVAAEVGPKVREAIHGIAGGLLDLQRKAKAGEVRPEFDVLGSFERAAQLFKRYAKEGSAKKIIEELNRHADQPELIKGSDLTKEIGQLEAGFIVGLANAEKLKNPAENMMEAMGQLQQQAADEKPGQGYLLGKFDPTSITRTLFGKQVADQVAKFRPPGEESGELAQATAPGPIAAARKRAGERGSAISPIDLAGVAVDAGKDIAKGVSQDLGKARESGKRVASTIFADPQLRHWEVKNGQDARMRVAQFETAKRGANITAEENSRALQIRVKLKPGELDATNKLIISLSSLDNIDRGMEAPGGKTRAQLTADLADARNDLGRARADELQKAFRDYGNQIGDLGLQGGVFKKEQIFNPDGTRRFPNWAHHVYYDPVLKRLAADEPAGSEVAGIRESRPGASKRREGDAGKVEDPIRTYAIAEAEVRRAIAAKKLTADLTNAHGNNEAARTAGELPDDYTLYDFKRGEIPRDPEDLAKRALAREKNGKVSVSTGLEKVNGKWREQFYKRDVGGDDPIVDAQGSEYAVLPKELAEGLERHAVGSRIGDVERGMRWLDNTLTGASINPITNFPFHVSLTAKHLATFFLNAPVGGSKALDWVPGKLWVDYGANAAKLAKAFYDVYVKGKDNPLLNELRESGILGSQFENLYDLFDDHVVSDKTLRASLRSPYGKANAILMSANEFMRIAGTVRDTAAKMTLRDRFRGTLPDISDEGATALANQRMGGYDIVSPLERWASPLTRFTHWWTNQAAELTTRLGVNPLKDVGSDGGLADWAKSHDLRGLWSSPIPKLAIMTALIMAVNHRDDETAKAWESLPEKDKFSIVTGHRTKDGRRIVVGVESMLNSIAGAGDVVRNLIKGEPSRAAEDVFRYWAGKIAPHLRVPFEAWSGDVGSKVGTGAPIISAGHKNLTHEEQAHENEKMGKLPVGDTANYVLEQLAPGVSALSRFRNKTKQEPADTAEASGLPVKAVDETAGVKEARSRWAQRSYQRLRELMYADDPKNPIERTRREQEIDRLIQQFSEWGIPWKTLHAKLRAADKELGREEAMEPADLKEWRERKIPR